MNAFCPALHTTYLSLAVGNRFLRARVFTNYSVPICPCPLHFLLSSCSVKFNFFPGHSSRTELRSQCFPFSQFRRSTKFSFPNPVLNDDRRFAVSLDRTLPLIVFQSSFLPLHRLQIRLNDTDGSRYCGLHGPAAYHSCQFAAIG